MERCDATELCGTKADGTTKDTTTMAGENGKAFVTEGNTRTNLVDGTGENESFTASSNLSAISMFILLLKNCYENKFLLTESIFKFMITL